MIDTRIATWIATWIKTMVVTLLETLFRCRRPAAQRPAAEPITLGVMVRRNCSLFLSEIVEADAQWTWQELLDTLDLHDTWKPDYAIVGKTPVDLELVLSEPLSKSGVVSGVYPQNHIMLLPILACSFNVFVTSSLGVQTDDDSEFELTISPNMTHAEIWEWVDFALEQFSIVHELKQLTFVCQSDPTRNFDVTNTDTLISLDIYTKPWKLYADGLALVHPNDAEYREHTSDADGDNEEDAEHAEHVDDDEHTEHVKHVDNEDEHAERAEYVDHVDGDEDDGKGEHVDDGDVDDDEDSDDDEPLTKIYVRMNDCSTHTFYATLRPDTTIDAVKRVCRRLFRLGDHPLRIVYAGKPLQDCKTLASYNIPDDSTLYCAISLKVGGYESD